MTKAILKDCSQRTAHAKRAKPWKHLATGTLALMTGLTLALASAVAEPAKVVIGISSRSFNPGFSNMWIGIPLGLYGKEIAPESVGTQGVAENLQLMLSGQVTMSTGTQDVIFNAAAEGRPLPAVIPCVYLRGLIHRVSVLPDSPISSYADLKDKRVGLPTLAYGGVPYLKFAARHANIDPDSIQMVAVGDGQQAAAALTSGRVDALTNADVDVARLTGLGVKLRVVPPPQDLKDAANAYVFAFARPWYDGHKKEAALLLKGMIRAIVVMLENPEAAVRVSYYMHPEAIPAGVPFEQAVASAVETIKVRAPAIERVVPGSNRWCDFSPVAWQNFTDMIGVKGKVDPAKFYTDELIAQINEFDEPKLRAWARSLKVPANSDDIGNWLKTLHPPL
jgi:NitT/TauT family transport system substrate-binding protein